MFKIGQLAQVSGVSIQTIRFYENEGLISPVEVDRWTNYRYYDESSVNRLSEISYLKNLGFSLKEIKNLDESTIQNKIKQTRADIGKLTKNIDKLSSIRKKEGGFNMKNFINDEKVVGKWHKIGVIKKIEDFAKKEFDDNRIFDFDELFFLPNGEKYWIFEWSKGTLYVKDRAFPYQIIDGKLFLSIIDAKTNLADNYAVYEKVDDKKYSREEIEIIDKIDIPFIKDESVVGFWEVVDFVEKFENFKPTHATNSGLYLKKYTFEPNGDLIVEFGENRISKLKWSKGVVMNEQIHTASEYIIKNLDGEKYMCVEWKSGDYTFGGKVNGYYVLRKID